MMAIVKKHGYKDSTNIAGATSDKNFRRHFFNISVKIDQAQQTRDDFESKIKFTASSKLVLIIVPAGNDSEVILSP